MNLLETIGQLGGLLIGFLLTLFVFSYVLRDNPLYRFVVHVLVGVSAGYASVIVVREVIFPAFSTIIGDPLSLASLGWLIPLLLAVMLVSKAVPQASMVGNAAMATLMAIGAAVGLVGAVAGTLLPLVTASYDSALLALVAAVLTVCTLAYFQFTDRLPIRNTQILPAWFSNVRMAGKILITVALAGVFAGVLNTSLVILSDRVGFYLNSIALILSSVGS